MCYLLVVIILVYFYLYYNVRFSWKELLYFNIEINFSLRFEYGIYRELNCFFILRFCSFLFIVMI